MAQVLDAPGMPSLGGVPGMGGDPEEDPGHAGVTMSHGWPGNTLGSSQKSWRRCPGRGWMDVVQTDTSSAPSAAAVCQPPIK